jgi:hypothetical protein
MREALFSCDLRHQWSLFGKSPLLVPCCRWARIRPVVASIRKNSSRVVTYQMTAAFFPSMKSNVTFTNGAGVTRFRSAIRTACSCDSNASVYAHCTQSPRTPTTTSLPASSLPITICLHGNVCVPCAEVTERRGVLLCATATAVSRSVQSRPPLTCWEVEPGVEAASGPIGRMPVAHPASSNGNRRAKLRFTQTPPSTVQFYLFDGIA